MVQQPVGNQNQFGDALQVLLNQGGEVEALGELGEDVGDGICPGVVVLAAFGFGFGGVDVGVGEKPVVV